MIGFILGLILFVAGLWGAIDADRRGERLWQVALLLTAAWGAYLMFAAVFG